MNEHDRQMALHALEWLRRTILGQIPSPRARMEGERLTAALVELSITDLRRVVAELPE